MAELIDNDTESPPSWTIQDTAKYLRCNNETVRRLIKNQELRAYRIGGLIRLRKSDIDAALERI